MKSIDPNIEISEGVLVKDSLLSEISFDVKAYAEVINPIKDGEISLKEAKYRQRNYHYYLNIKRKGNTNSVQKKALSNIENHYNARERVINFIEDFGSMVLEAKRLAREKEEF